MRGKRYPGLRGKVVDWVEHEFNSPKARCTSTSGFRIRPNSHTRLARASSSKKKSSATSRRETIACSRNLSPTSRADGRSQNCASLPVDALVQPANQAIGADFEHLADSQQCRHRDGAASLDLLPMPCGETQSNHVFLRVTGVLPELLHPLPEGAKELGVVDHAFLCSCIRAEIPRAD